MYVIPYLGLITLAHTSVMQSLQSVFSTLVEARFGEWQDLMTVGFDSS